MRIIDANTGTDVELGVPFHNVNGTITLLDVDERLFSARGLFDRDGKRVWVPLQVRFTHPGFFLQKVGFVPS